MRPKRGRQTHTNLQLLQLCVDRTDKSIFPTIHAYKKLLLILFDANQIRRQNKTRRITSFTFHIFFCES